MKEKSLSCVRLLATPWSAAYQAPWSMGFSRQKYWSGLPLPSPISNKCHGYGGDRVPDELWTEVHDILQETEIKTIPMEKLFGALGSLCNFCLDTTAAGAL